LGNSKERERVCEEARLFLASVEPAVLHEAERRLMEKGVPVEDLHRLCAIHIRLFEEEEEDNQTESAVFTASSYIIETLQHEHEIILDLLEELEGIGHTLQSTEIYSLNSRELVRLPALADKLINVESHLAREEQVVFAELARMKVRCSPKMLAAEHQRLRDELASLSELVHSHTTDMERFRQKAVSNINVIVPVWWRHIFKENNILFPSFIEHATDEQRVIELRTLCDQIGYAGFEKIHAFHNVV
jgi:DUF438 domain-containing protein